MMTLLSLGVALKRSLSLDGGRERDGGTRKGPKPEKSDFRFSLKQRGAINTKGSKNLPCHQEMSGQ